MLRIAFVTPEYISEHKFDGGLANYVHRVGLSLLELGHQPIVFVPSTQDEALLHNGIEVHGVRLPRNLWAARLNRVTRMQFKKTLHLTSQSRALNARVRQVHARQPLSLIQYAHLAGVGLFRLREVPAVVRLSSYTPLWRMKGGYNSEGRWAVRQQEWIERRAMKKADELFGPSNVIGAAVEKGLGRPVRIIETPYVPDQAETDGSLYRDALQDKSYLLFFGTLNALKGVVTLAETLERLLSRHRDLRFVFIGNEDGGYQGSPMMEYVWKKAGPHKGRVLHLGKLRHDRLYPILDHARAVVLPSRIDNFPNACLEAMAHRKPVVGTRGASFEQMLVDSESGFLCEIDDPASLLAAMEKALHLTEAQRHGMGQKAWERVQQLRPEVVARQLVTFYEEVIKSAEQPGRKASPPLPEFNRSIPYE